MSNKTLRTGMQKTLSKNCEINSSASSCKVEFTGAYRQFGHLEISLVYNEK